MSPGPTNEKNPQRKRGPYATKRHITVPVRLASRRELDEWRRQQHDLPRRKEAIRRLVALALENERELSQLLR